MAGVQHGVAAFRKEYFASGAGDNEKWESHEARCARYALYWALLENNAYDNVNRWAQSYRSAYGLYRFTRNIYNPAYRLASFHKSHIWGGRLDVKEGVAGEAGALPIKTGSDDVRKAIAALWRASNWASQKDITTFRTAAMGDGAIKIVDDSERKRVYMQTLQPSMLKSVEVEHDNVKAYELEYEVDDEKENGQAVKYGERASRDGQDVVYETFRNGKPHDWGYGATTWRVPLGFVPLVLIQHNNVGIEWGWSEIHPCLSKIREVDDIASKLSDQIRKMVDAPWLFAGVSEPKTQPTTSSRAAEVDKAMAAQRNAEAGRQEVPALYGPVGATATPLVAPLNIASTLDHIEAINGELEKEFPELRYELGKVSGDISGRALRIARQDVETKVQERRLRYDSALVRAQQMAIAIGGYREYEGYQAFGLDSYDAGALDHEIAERPVFAEDALDKFEIESALWDAASKAEDAGCPLPVFLKRQGWTQPDIDAVVNTEEYRARQTVRSLGMMQPRTQITDPAPGGTDPTPADNNGTQPGQRRGGNASDNAADAGGQP
jgi:hypothetical protein